MAIGNWDVLSTIEKEALLTSSTILLDQLLEDIIELEGGGDVSDTWMIAFLPRLFKHHYTLGFAREFLFATSVVAWKLAQDNRYMLTCVAEEIALHAIIKSAESLLEVFEQDGSYDSFIDEAYEDTDFLMLFEAKNDGIQDSAVGHRLGIGHLEFNEWFLEFGGGSRGRVQLYGEHYPTPEWMQSRD